MGSAAEPQANKDTKEKSAFTGARFVFRSGVNGAPGEIRTPGLLIRSQSLYPAELRAHIEGGSLLNLN